MRRWRCVWLCVWLVPAAGLAQDTPPGGEPPQEEAPPAPPEAPPPVAEPSAEPPAAPATPAAAPAATLQTPEQLAAQTGWSVLAVLGNIVGHGTLVAPAQVGYVATSLTVQPRYNFRGPASLRLVASASASASFEYTPPDNSTGRRLDWTDVRLSLSAPAAFEEPLTGVALSPVLSLTLPTSLRSWWGGTLGVLGVGVSLSRTLGPWQLGYQLGGGRGFHRSAAVGAAAPGQGGDVRRDAAGTPLDICRAGQALCAAAGLNTAWTLSQALSATYVPTERLFASLGVSLAHQWRYAATDAPDDLTAPTRDADGSPVAHPGMGRADLLSVSLGAGYAVTDRLSLSVGVSDAGPPLSRDNRRPRLLFVEGAVANGTTYSVSLSALY